MDKNTELSQGFLILALSIRVVIIMRIVENKAFYIPPVNTRGFGGLKLFEFLKQFYGDFWTF